MRAMASSTALLIIDVQHRLFDVDPRPADADFVLDRINALAARARESGSPVFVVQHASPDGTALAHGSDNWQLAKRLVLREDQGDVVVHKRSPDAFHQTDLADALAARGVRRVVVCGYATEFCIDTTVRRAAALGLAVTLAADAHTTHDKPHADAAWIRRHHNATLPQLTSFFVPIEAVATSQVVFADGPDAAEAPAQAAARAVVRVATREDVAQIQRVRAAVRENRLVTRRISDDEVIEAIERTGRGWVADLDGRIVGFSIGNGETGNIWALFVEPGHDTLGLGRRLHDVMLDWLHTRGLPRLYLGTDPDSRAARFYERAGWRRVGLDEWGEMVFERDGSA